MGIAKRDLLHAVLSAAAARGIGQILHVRFRPAAGEGEHELARPRLTVAAGLGKRVLGGAGDGEGLHEAVIECLRRLFARVLAADGGGEVGLRQPRRLQQRCLG